MSDSVRPHRRQPTRLPRPWDSPGKNIGVGCHFLLQCMKAKSESEVAQSCPTLSDPMDCSLPGSSVHGTLQGRVLEWVVIPSSRGSSQPRDRTCVSYIYLYWHMGSLPLVPPGKPQSLSLLIQNFFHILQLGGKFFPNFIYFIYMYISWLLFVYPDFFFFKWLITSDI